MDHYLNHEYDPYPYGATIDEAENVGSFVCHTSGTTGIPKPCIYTHEFILRVARTLKLAPPDGYTMLHSRLGHNTHILLLPLFHPGGVQLAIINAIYNRCVVVLPSWTAPPSVESLLAISRNVEADWAMTAPATLEALAKDETALIELTGRLKMFVFAGGSLPKALGDIIAQKVQLVTFLGSSETAGLPIMYPEEMDAMRDWEYMAFHPKLGAALECSTGDSFELVLERSASTEPYQPIFTRFPDLTRFNTGDLFKRHPTRHDMWAHASRADDIIVFLNGEKTNPVTFESHLSKHPDIEGAVMFGDQRFEPGVLIELKGQIAPSIPDANQYIERLWLSIDEANHDSPAHARVAKSHILFTQPGRRLLRTPKGTVMRKATLDQYKEDIDKLYETVESTRTGSADSAESFVSPDDLEAVLTVIRAAYSEYAALSDLESDDDDLLARGIDSLQVLRLCRNLRSKIAVENLKPATIYQNPTPLALARAIQSAAKGGTQPPDEDRGRRERLQNTLANSLHRIEESVENQPPAISKDGAENSHVCIVTGTTGSIGAYVLRALMEDKRIGTIYCLNRGPGSEQRQRIHNAEVDPQLPTTFPDNVHFIEADLSHDAFGLEPSLFETLSSSATLIVHNAWPVDFNLPLSAFAKALAGVENLCRFSARSALRPAIMFLSSISAMMGVAVSSSGAQRAVPEEISDDLSAPAAAGYAESKYVAERVLKHTAEKLHVPVTVVRIGQVCGAAHSPGRWNPKEWIPRLISGSVHLGAIPDSLGAYGAETLDVDWIPVDVLADAVTELLLKGPGSQSQIRRGPEVYHLNNTKRTSWAALLPSIIETLKDLKQASATGERVQDSVTVVSRQEWLRRLRDAVDSLDAHQDGQDPAEVSPALKLVDFYEEKLAETIFPEFEMASAVSASTVLQRITSISPENMGRWVRLWYKASGEI